MKLTFPSYSYDVISRPLSAACISKATLYLRLYTVRCIELISARKVMTVAFSAFGAVSDDPKSYREAMTSPEAKQWREAAKSEYESLMLNKTWRLVPKPKHANIVGSRWVFTRKRDEAGRIVRHKARFVAQGFSQKLGVDYTDTYSPVAQMQTIRVALAIAADQDWELGNMNVVTAFLHAEMDEKLYVKQPEGFQV